MSIVDVECDTLTVETVNSVTLAQDRKGKSVFHCLRQDFDNKLEQPHNQLCFSKDVFSPHESSPCISVVVSENDPNFNIAMTATTDIANGDLHEETVTQVQILQCVKPDDSSVGNEEVTPVSQAWFTTKEDKDSLTNKGHKWKKGMWSKEEIGLLMCNIDRYLKARDLTDASEIIFEMSKDERKDFYRTIAWGLNRPLFAVYRRVLRMYDDTNHVGKYTPEEIHRLRELRIKHGNDWASIGAALGRSACSVKDRCRLMKETCNRGKWTEDEERRLAEAVHELTGTDTGDAVTGGVAWAAVAERVGSRSEKQCRSKWLNYLNWKQSGGTEWTKEDELTLILRINKLGVLDENDINWDIIADGWSSVRSPQWLRSKWWTVKRQIANHKDVTFPVLMKGLQHLHENQSKLSGNLVTEKNYGTGFFSNNLNSGVQHVQIRLTHFEENSNIPQSPVGVLQVPAENSQVSSTDSHCGGDADAISLNSGSLQTIELLPSFYLQPTATPGTFLLQTTSSHGIPLTLTASSAVSLTDHAAPTSPDQMLLQSLPTEHLLNTSDSLPLCCRTPINTDDIASSTSQDELTVEPEYLQDLAGHPNTLEADTFTDKLQLPKQVAVELSMHGMKEPVNFNGRTNVELVEHVGTTCEDISNSDLKQKGVLHQDLARDFVTR